MAEKILKKDGKLQMFGNSYVLAPTLYNSIPTGAPTGYIALFKFEDNVVDTTGNYTATAYNYPTYADGKIDRCIVFGTSKYVTTDLYKSFFENNNYTISTWLKFTSTVRGVPMMASDGGGGNGIIINNTAGKISTQGSVISQTITTSNSYNDGAWHLVVSLWDKTSKTITLNIDNGAEIVTNTTASSIYVKTAQFTFGRHGTYPGVYYNGSIDNTYIYDKVLNSDEISQLWNNGTGL